MGRKMSDSEFIKKVNQTEKIKAGGIIIFLKNRHIPIVEEIDEPLTLELHLLGSNIIYYKNGEKNRLSLNDITSINGISRYFD